MLLHHSMVLNDKHILGRTNCLLSFDMTWAAKKTQLQQFIVAAECVYGATALQLWGGGGGGFKENVKHIGF
jgi:hypothetical protein